MSYIAAQEEFGSGADTVVAKMVEELETAERVMKASASASPLDQGFPLSLLPNLSKNVILKTEKNCAGYMVLLIEKGYFFQIQFTSFLPPPLFTIPEEMGGVWQRLDKRAT